ncbi:MAG TPA: BrnT family toxin [Candidatus Kapabacteria bacterium]|nr:BrnT family toxin [Candidatus Kapabacteria bacterium]
MNIERLIAQSTGFDWDEANIGKNWIKHKVSPDEVEQVFFNKPLLLLDDEKHSNKEQRFIAMGKTDAGRLLFISWTLRNNMIRAISCRPMHSKERRVYEQEA